MIFVHLEATLIMLYAYNYTNCRQTHKDSV